MAELHHVQSSILNAIRQKNPSIQPGETFDWLIVHSKLRHTVTTEEFVEAMRALAEAGMIDADETRRRFLLTEKGFEAMASDALSVAGKAA